MRKKIKKLEEELDWALYAIINLMPYEINRVLRGFYGAESMRDIYDWEQRTLDFIISQATVRGIYTRDYAHCPLCGKGPNSSYGQGFAFPDGLLRHLEGRSGAHKCSVMKAAWKLAINYRDRHIPDWWKNG